MDRPRTQQEELERVSRALRTLSGSNRALLRAEEETSLLHEICRVVVEEAGYYAAPVGRKEHDAGKTVTRLATVGADGGPPDTRDPTWADMEHGHSATGIAIRTGEPCLINDVLGRAPSPTSGASAPVFAASGRCCRCRFESTAKYSAR